MDFGVKEKCISTNNTYDFFLFLTVILILSLGQSNHTLLSLRLSGNKIGNEGSMHMASLLQVNDTLEELELSDCDLVNTHTHTHTTSQSEATMTNSTLLSLRPLRV